MTRVWYVWLKHGNNADPTELARCTSEKMANNIKRRWERQLPGGRITVGWADEV